MTADLSGIIDEVKTDKNFATTFTKKGDHAKSVKILDKAVKKLVDHVPLDGSGLQPPSEVERKAAAQLADCYGSWGGALRRNKQYDESVAAYDSGFEIESHPRYGIINSYNLVQRLVARILASPNVLNSPKSLASLVVPENSTVLKELATAKQEVQNQLNGTRAGDLWGKADEATVLLLLGEYDQADNAWKSLVKDKPSKEFIDSTRDMVTLVADKFADGEMKDALNGAIKDLTSP